MTKQINLVQPKSHLQGVYVVSGGTGPSAGLYRFIQREGVWSNTHLATVNHLSALTWHPVLPIVYGVSGDSTSGFIHVWDVSGAGVLTMAEISSGGAMPCHLAVDTNARILVIANYATNALTVWPLLEDGSLMGRGEKIELSGSSMDPSRQAASHPHQVVFHGNLLLVVDLGADAVHTFELSRDATDAKTLTLLRENKVPVGTGPRHLVVLPNTAFALTGELGSTVLAGYPTDSSIQWLVSSSSQRMKSSATDGLRNFPGDVQASSNGKLVYVANRGYDTIATFAVGQGAPQLIAEIDSGVAWPQKLLVTENELLVAGRDSSLVVSLPLIHGIPKEHRVLFECVGAEWLLPLNQMHNRLKDSLVTAE